LFQEIAYFDDHNNSTGALTTRLSTEASAVQGVSMLCNYQLAIWQLSGMLNISSPSVDNLLLININGYCGDGGGGGYCGTEYTYAEYLR